MLRVLRPRNYGVAEGDADGEGDSSAVAAFFFLGEGEADVSAVVAVVDFFLVDVAVVPAVDFFLVVEVDAAVVEVEVASSFFCAQETTKPAATRAMIQDKTDFFIGMVKRFRLFGRRTNRKQLIPNREGFRSFSAPPPGRPKLAVATIGALRPAERTFFLSSCIPSPSSFVP